MVKPNGFVIYRGPSQLDGSPIVAIVTGINSKSGNAKTGAMLQTWILRADVDPFDATKSGADASVCGNCKHRPANGGACYVRVYQAPKSVFKAFRAGRYPVASDIPAIGAGRAVRIGSYGDPAAVPVAVWQSLIERAASHTGYTHQWRRAPELAPIVMASVDTPSEFGAARVAGWRTFRVRLASDNLAPRESVCPASHEAGAKVSCAQCGACNGNATQRKSSIAIVVHGALARRYEKMRAAAPADIARDWTGAPLTHPIPGTAVAR